MSARSCPSSTWSGGRRRRPSSRSTAWTTAAPDPLGEVEDDLVAWGRVVRIEARGRRSGRVVPVVVGFAERPEGAIVVAATAPDSGWSSNLLAEPRCRVTLGDASWDAVARPLAGAEHA